MARLNSICRRRGRTRPCSCSQEGHAALAGLAVDADDRVVAAAQVGRVDGQVGDFPGGVGLLHREALLDGVLVRAGEGREDQVAGVGVARVHGQLVAVFDAAADFVDVGEVQARMDALGVQVQRQGDQVHVAGALAVAEQAAFDAVGAGHDGEFGGGHGRTPVIVGMDAEDDLVALRQMGVHPFDLVGVQVRGGGLDRGRQVQDDLVLDGRLPGVDHGVADFQREVGFGGAEDFRRIFVAPVGFRMLGDFGLDDPGALDGDGADLVAAHAEDDLAEGRRAGVVHVDDGVLRARAGFDRALDQVLAGLGQGDDGDVVGDALFVDQLAHEVEVGLGRGRKADLDFLEADLQQLLEEAQLALHAHGFDQRLVAVAQVGAHPDRGGGDAAAGPGALGEVARERGERNVFFGGVLDHVGTCLGGCARIADAEMRGCGETGCRTATRR